MEITDPAAKRVSLSLSCSPGNWLDHLPSETVGAECPEALDNQTEFEPSVFTDPQQTGDHAGSTSSQPAEDSSDSSTAPINGLSISLEISAGVGPDQFASHLGIQPQHRKS